MEKFYRDVYTIMYRLRNKVEKYNAKDDWIIERLGLIYNIMPPYTITYSIPMSSGDIYNFVNVKYIIFSAEDYTRTNEFFKRHKI